MKQLNWGVFSGKTVQLITGNAWVRYLFFKRYHLDKGKNCLQSEENILAVRLKLQSSQMCGF